jgi:hypothetical protein
VIGYSLPAADPYTRQVLYRIARGYVRARSDPKWRLGPMNPIVLIDRRTTDDGIRELKETYRFLPAEHTEFILDGFTAASFESLFREARSAAA